MKRKTKPLAIIGDPVQHSLSPSMQNAALRECGLDYRYEKILVRPEELDRFMKKKAIQLAGFNVTVPHKEKILPHLDFVVPLARSIGAVNTVWNHRGMLIGFNTDGNGYLMSLEQEKRFKVPQSQILILGAGGAARSLVVSLHLAGASKIVLANRTLGRAQRLAGSLKKKFSKLRLQACSLTGPDFPKNLKQTDLLINTTTVGLNGTAFPNFPWKALRSGATVSDIVYHPRMTPLLKSAQQHGHPVHTGEGMLVYQGALSFEIWTGRAPSAKTMLKVLRKKLS